MQIKIVHEYEDRKTIEFEDALGDDSAITSYKDDYLTIHCTDDALVLTKDMSIDFAKKVLELCGCSLETENQKLREQRDAANAQIQMLNRIIAGDVE